MTEMTAAEAVAKTLVAHGVEYVFGLPGTSVLPLIDCLVDYPEIEYVLSLQEGVCVGLADGYARITGKPALVNVHNFPGTANCLNNLFNAYRERSPMIVTAGQQETWLLGTDAHSSTRDLPGVVEQCARWSWETRSPSRIAADLTRALTIATLHPRGPAFLSLPMDQLKAKVDVEIRRSAGFPKPAQIQADPDLLAEAAAMLVEAERPIIVAGSEVVPAGGVADLIALAELLAIPVVTEPCLSYLGFPTDHPLFFGSFSPNHPLVQEADVLFGAGCRLFVELMPRPNPINPHTRVIHLNVDAAEINKMIPTEVGIVADARSGIRGILENSRERVTPQIENRATLRRSRLEAAQGARRAALKRDLEADLESVPIKPWRVIKELSELLDKRAIIVDEGVGASSYLRDFFPFSDPSCYIGKSAGGLGWGLPAAIGAKLGAPDRPVVSYLGDGAFLMAIQGLWTAARYDVPVVFIVNNNRGYSMVKGPLRRFNGRAAASGIDLGVDIENPNIDIVKLSESFGVRAMLVERPGEIRPAIEGALASGKPAVIDVRVDRTEGARGMPRIQ